MAVLKNLTASTNPDIIETSTGTALTLANLSTGHALQVGTTGVGTAINAVISGVSGSVLKLNTVGYGLFSSNSCASLSYAFSVQISGKLYYVPCYLSA